MRCDATRDGSRTIISRYVCRYELLLFEQGDMLVARNSAARTHLHSYLHNGSIFVLSVMVGDGNDRKRECSVLHEFL